MSKIQKILSAKGTDVEGRAVQVAADVKREITKNTKTRIEDAIAKKKSEIADLEDQVSLVTDVNAGRNKMSTADVTNIFSKIFTLEIEIKDLQDELNDIVTPFLKKYFEDEVK